MVKVVERRYRDGDIIDIDEYLDGRYGAPGTERSDKKKPTEEQMRKVNAYNKMRRCRARLLEYFNPNDLFVTWTYEVKNRPPDIKTAKKHFGDAIRQIRQCYKIRGRTLFWIRNIEQGTKGAWHIHLVINKIDGTEETVRKAWQHGGTYIEEIRLSEKLYDEDFTKLASYMTKDEYSTEATKDGGQSKPRIKQASYSTSRNMPLKEPRSHRRLRWKRVIKPKKGYVILHSHEGKNPATGYPYRRYTMVRKRGDPE